MSPASAMPASGGPASSASAPDIPIVGARRLIGTLALSLATFMSVLDISIANVSIPAIAGDLGVSPHQGTWIITSFGVATAISLPLTGWLVQRIGTVRLFVGSVLFFTLMSLLCGAAPTIEALVVLRVLQGAAAGPMIPLCQALLLRSYPPNRLGFALGALAITTLMAPLTGPLLGGWLTDNHSWRWIFYVNGPVGLVSAAVAWRIFRPLETALRRAPIDGIGLALLVVWVGSLQLVFDLGKDRDWFDSQLILMLALTAALAFAVFMVWELTEPDPVIDLSLFRIRSFWVGTLAMSMAYALFLGNLVLLPLWLQQHVGYTATLAGLVLAPAGVLGILATPFVGRLIGRSDPRWLVSAAFIVFSGSMWMRAQLGADADLASFMLPSLVQGAGNAMFFVPLLALILARLPADRIAAGSGVSNFLRYTAGAFGTSLITTAWGWRAAFHRTRLMEAVSEGTGPLAAMRDALATVGLSDRQQFAAIERAVEQQAHTLAVNEIFMLSAILYLGLIGVLWAGYRDVSASGNAGPGP